MRLHEDWEEGAEVGAEVEVVALLMAIQFD
jgi:hypothetical protein